jgi:hypothetical protein
VVRDIQANNAEQGYTRYRQRRGHRS